MTNKEKQIVKALKENIAITFKQKDQYSFNAKIGGVVTSEKKLKEMVAKGILKYGEHPLLGNSVTYYVNDDYK